MRLLPVVAFSLLSSLTVTVGGCGKSGSKPAPAKDDGTKKTELSSVQGGVQGSEGCGFADIDGTKIPLDCDDGKYGNIPSAAVVPFRSQLHSDEESGTETYGTKKKKSKAKLPKKVDHRADKTEGPIRDQGPVGACTAFSLAAAIDHALMRSDDEAEPVSVMHLWARYASPSMVAAVSSNEDKPISLEQKWPYDPDDACSWLDPQWCKKACGKPSTYCGDEPPSKTFKSANKKAVAKIAQIVKLDLDDAKAFREALAKGQDIWFAMKIGAEFVKVRSDEVPDFNASGSMSAHAMVLAGYRKVDGEYQYLIHNSWGKKWGNKGWSWIGEDTLFKNINYAYLVDAEPTDSEGHSFQPKGSVGKPKAFVQMGGLTECKKGEVPDAMTKTCSKPCADGSPPVSGKCGNCSDDDDSCATAAPDKRGLDPKTGTSYTCGAGGCVYSIPKGQYGCTKEICEVSCAAPKFLLSYGTSGVRCTE